MEEVNMVAKAASAAPHAGRKAPEVARSGRFWRWALGVSAVVGPAYTAAPVWADKLLATYNNFHSGSYKEGQEQLRLAYRNMDCLRAPYKYYTNPNQLRIDGTICKSGDVLVRAVDGLQRQAVYFVSVAAIQRRIESATPQPEAAPAATPAALEEWGGTAANGAVIRAALGTGFAAGAPDPYFHLAQMVRILWTRPVPGNPRFIIQHIQRPDGCFDQVIDLANGAVVRITPAPC
jgi:hypothetical protein